MRSLAEDRLWVQFVESLPEGGEEAEGYHSLGERSVPSRLVYRQTGDRWTVSGGYERSLRYDSSVALVGDRVNGRTIGSARENRFQLSALYEHERREFLLEPYGGFVDAKSVAGNPFVGVHTRSAYRLLESDRFELSPLLHAEIYHYRFDAFGVAPGPGQPRRGGYFSPQLFTSLGAAYTRVGAMTSLTFEF